MIPLQRKLVALVSVILSVIAGGHSHAGDSPWTAEALSTPSGRTGLWVTTTRGMACEAPHDPCLAYVLTPEEFERDKNGSKCDRKPAGPTLVVITDIGPGTYYAGVQTVIDESVVGTETVTETVQARSFSLSRKRPAYGEYLADDFPEMMLRLLQSDEPEMVDEQKLHPMLNSWLRKWYKAEVKNGRLSPVVAVFLKKTSRPSEWDQFYVKRRTYRITCRSMSDLWDQSNFLGIGEHVVGRLEREVLEYLLLRGARVCSPSPSVGTVWIDEDGRLWAFCQIPSDKTYTGGVSAESAAPIARSEASLLDARQEGHKVLPRLAEFLARGENKVRVSSPNGLIVHLGLRTKVAGIDFKVSERRGRSVYMSNGLYEIYFVYQNEAGDPYMRDVFNPSNHGVEVRLIIKIADGN